jgi:hypothetical protein
MAAKKDTEHAHAFDKGEDAAKLAATSEQYQEQTGQSDVEAGPDPVIEAQDKATEEALKDTEPVRDQAQVREDLEQEEKEAWDESTPPSEPDTKAQARAKEAEQAAKDSEAAKQS